MGIEGRFEAAHEGEVRTRRAPNVDGALESGWAPRERGEGVFGSAEREDTRGSVSEVLDRGGVVRVGEQSKIEDSASACENRVGERSLVGERAQLLEK